jgi:hypothetical protein
MQVTNLVTMPGRYRGSRRRLETAAGRVGRSGSGEGDGLAGTGHHVHEFAFDGVLVVEQEPAPPGEDPAAMVATGSATAAENKNRRETAPGMIRLCSAMDGSLS